MNMRMKKLCAILLASSMVLSLAACGGSGNDSQPEQDTTQSEAEKPSDDAKPETDNAADDPITYTFFVRDPGVVPSDDNPVLKKITELTGVTIKFEFLVGDLDQKLGVMIAGGDYPDAIFAGDAGMKLRDAGAFIPLEEEIPKYPNLNALYGDVMKYLTQPDGHVYDMELYGPFQGKVTEVSPTFECGLGFYIQKAVLEEAGYPEIGTLLKLPSSKSAMMPMSSI